jgi:hypothetical protein
MANIKLKGTIIIGIPLLNDITRISYKQAIKIKYIFLNNLRLQVLKIRKKGFWE